MVKLLVLNSGLVCSEGSASGELVALGLDLLGDAMQRSYLAVGGFPAGVRNGCRGFWRVWWRGGGCGLRMKFGGVE